MWENAFDIIASNGVWAVLFFLLLVYELKDSRKREVKYQDTVSSLSGSLTCVKEISRDVETIKEDVKVGFGLMSENEEPAAAVSAA